MALNLWEPYVSRVFTPKSGDIVLDAGAHIGYHTLKAANKVGSKGKVVAVEPDYRNTTVLRYNIKRKNAENITLIDCALGDHVGYATFKLAEIL